MNKVDIDLTRFSAEELMELNARIIERIKYLRQVRQFENLSQFSLGETVCFNSRDGQVVTGQIIRLNKMTATIISRDRVRWKVSPSLLSKVVQQEHNDSDGGNVINLSNRDQRNLFQKG